LPLHGGARGQDDLLDSAPAHPLQESRDAKLVGSHALQGVEGAVEHVVAPLVVAGLLDRDEVVGRFHHAHEPPARRGVGAGRAGLLVGDRVADSARPDAVQEGGHGLREARGFLAGSPQQVEGDPLRGLRPDARELSELVHQPGDGRGIVHQVRPGIFSPPVSPPIFSWTSSSTLRAASFTAATTRSWSISTSSLLTTSGSILRLLTCFWPSISTLTMP